MAATITDMDTARKAAQKVLEDEELQRSGDIYARRIREQLESIIAKARDGDPEKYIRIMSAINGALELARMAL